MASTKIEWTDWSIGATKFKLPSGKLVNLCAKKSPGCTHCYAEGIARHWWPKTAGSFPGFTEAATKAHPAVLDEHALQSVLRRRKPTRIFWDSATDLFGEWVTDRMLDTCFAVMALTPHHTHLLLTKRHKRMREYLTLRCSGRYASGANPIREIINRDFSGQGDHSGTLVMPLPNVWIGVTVENQKAADERIPHLLATPAALRFVSYEPALGPVILSGDGEHEYLPDEYCSPSDPPDRINWVIAGGESGHNARPSHPDWFRSLRDQCKAAGVPFMFKQWGEWVALDCLPIGHPIRDIAKDAGDSRLRYIDYAGAVYHVDYAPCSSYLVAPVGTRKSGHLLDGVEHMQIPQIGGR